MVLSTRANYIGRNIICINCHPRHHKWPGARLFVDSHHTWSIMDTFICRHHWTRHCDDLDDKVSIAINTLWEFVPRPLRSNWISYPLSISHKTQIIFCFYFSSILKIMHWDYEFLCTEKYWVFSTHTGLFCMWLWPLLHFSQISPTK